MVGTKQVFATQKELLCHLLHCHPDDRGYITTAPHLLLSYLPSILSAQGAKHSSNPEICARKHTEMCRLQDVTPPLTADIVAQNAIATVATHKPVIDRLPVCLPVCHRVRVLHHPKSIMSCQALVSAVSPVSNSAVGLMILTS